MREIKFKAYDTKSKIFFEQNNKYDFSYWIISWEIRGKYWEVFEDIILMQYVWYEDINSKWIYEWDIVEYYWKKLEVFFRNWCFVFWDKEKDIGYFFHGNNKDLKVIWNIYKKTSN